MHDWLAQENFSVLDQVFDGIYVMDPERRIVFWNRGAEEITGYLRQEMVGRKCPDVPLNHLNEAGCQLCQDMCPAVQVIQTGHSEKAVVFAHIADGRLIPVETHICPLADANGRVIGAIEIFRDISQWKQLEDVTLEKSRLMDILAHDIRNPMTVVQTYGRILSADADAQKREMATALLRQSQYVLTLVDHLLNASTLDQTSIPLAIQTLGVEAALKGCLQICSFAAQKKGAALVLEAVSPGLLFETDLDRFTEIMDNIISNAIKYSPTGAVVRVQVRSLPEAVEIRVCDQGPGIKLEEQAKLFKPFGITSNRPSGGEKSYGFGLFIVKKLMDFFRGSVRLESSPGRGTAVILVFPLRFNLHPKA